MTRWNLIGHPLIHDAGLSISLRCYSMVYYALLQSERSKRKGKYPFMLATAVMPQTALKYEVEVQKTGRIELDVPFAQGARLLIFVIQDMTDAFTDLLSAAQSSLEFWDNPLDDEDWNEDTTNA